MSVTTTEPLARTDASAAAVPASDPTHFVRRAGAAVTIGALTWAGGLAAVGAQPDTEVGVTIGDLTAIPFQLGLFALVTAQLRTRATGTSKVAAAMLRVEYVLLALASLWTVLHGGFPALRDEAWLVVLDLFWPLSMLGMFVIGVKIAFAGRWRGVARAWPLLAESWAPVTVPAMAVFGSPVGDWVGVGHLVLGYGVLGLILATRPRLTTTRP